MQGYHEVKIFKLVPDRLQWDLPEGWKPFAALADPDGNVCVVTRKWVRSEGKAVTFDSVDAGRTR